MYFLSFSLKSNTIKDLVFNQVPRTFQKVTTIPLLCRWVPRKNWGQAIGSPGAGGETARGSLGLDSLAWTGRDCSRRARTAAQGGAGRCGSKPGEGWGKDGQWVRARALVRSGGGAGVFARRRTSVAEQLSGGTLLLAGDGARRGGGGTHARGIASVPS
jgi:hypothetical protein